MSSVTCSGFECVTTFLLPLLPLLQGHVYRSTTGKVERWFNPDWINLDHVPKTPVDLPLLKVGSSRHVRVG